MDTQRHKGGSGLMGASGQPPWGPGRTVLPVLEGRGELFGSDPGDARFFLGLLSCGERRLGLGPGVGGPGGRDGVWVKAWRGRAGRPPTLQRIGLGQDAGDLPTSFVIQQTPLCTTQAGHPPTALCTGQTASESRSLSLIQGELRS